MKNRVVGFIILGIAILIGYIIWSFNRALTKIVSVSCTHGSSCPMWSSISFQTNVSILIMVLVAIIGLYLIFFGKEEKIITKIKKVKVYPEIKKISKEDYKKIFEILTKDEKIIFEKIIEAGGAILQSELVEKSGFNKVKVTRLLDKLEANGIIERKRHGMSNLVLIKR